MPWPGKSCLVNRGRINATLIAERVFMTRTILKTTGKAGLSPNMEEISIVNFIVLLYCTVLYCCEDSPTTTETHLFGTTFCRQKALE